MDSFNRRSSKGASLASVYRLDTGLVQHAPNASLNPELWMLSSCRRLVFDAMPYTTIVKLWTNNGTGYSIKSVSLSPPHFKWATTRMRLRASLQCVFSTLMCFLNERLESHHSPRNFVDSSTGRIVFPILTMGGLWSRDRGAVKCMTLHLWVANLKPFLVAHSCMAFTACCRCFSMVSRKRPLKQNVLYWIYGLSYQIKESSLSQKLDYASLGNCLKEGPQWVSRVVFITNLL